MANTDEYYLLFNDEKLFLHNIGSRPVPVRISRRTAELIERDIKKLETDQFSCIKSMSTDWNYCSLIVSISYNPITKCKRSCGLLTKSSAIKTPICCDAVCRGQCKDKIMQDIIAKHIVPEKYADIQR